jgi:hypothetical protein
LENVRPGNYALRVIVYDPVSGKRLALDSFDQVTIGMLQVDP